MVLEHLCAIDRQLNKHDDTPAGYERKPVRWRILLRADGTPVGVIDTANPADRATRNGELLPIPWNGRTTDTNPRILVDNGEYIFGIPEKETSTARAEQRRKAFRAILERYLESTGERAIPSFLDSSHADEIVQEYLIGAKDLVAFEVDGEYLQDDERCRDFWAAHIDTANAGGDEEECMVCGKLRPAARVHPKILGVPGGQGAGNLLVSANESAFLSYGRDQSLIAPTCIPCSQSYVRGLNTLLKNEKMHFRTPKAVYVFFTEEQPTPAFQIPDQANRSRRVDEALELLRSPWTINTATQTIDEGRFIALSLTANSARVVVRSWIDSTIPQAKASLSRYFLLQQLVGPNGEDLRLTPLPELAKATTNPNAANTAGNMEQLLLALALSGGKMPRQALMGAVLRCRADQDVSPIRARLIKMVLASEKGKEPDDMAQLDPNSTDRAYLCGRLFETLGEIQRAALGETNTTVATRYFGAASTTPQTVFPRLITVAQGHFARLERTNPGARVNLEKQITSITDLIDHDFPRSLSASEQGRFMLGFYHQRAARFRSIAKNSEMSQESAASGGK